jgi:hypothetical protein
LAHHLSRHHRERVKYAIQRLNMFTTLFTKELISRKEFEEAEENAAVRLKELEETEAELAGFS